MRTTLGEIDEDAAEVLLENLPMSRLTDEMLEPLRQAKEDVRDAIDTLKETLEASMEEGAAAMVRDIFRQCEIDIGSSYAGGTGPDSSQPAIKVWYGELGKLFEVPFVGMLDDLMSPGWDPNERRELLVAMRTMIDARLAKLTSKK